MGASWVRHAGRVAAAAFCLAGTPATRGAETGLEWRGVALLPGRSTAADGSHRLAETSGIAWLGADRYLAVMDGDERAVVLRVALDAEGDPGEALVERTIPLDRPRDWEDVAVVGPAAARRLLAVEEDTPAIRVFALGAADDAPPAEPIVVWPLNTVFPAARANRGPESLAVEPGGEWLWTANEEPLEGDGPAVTDGATARVRLVRMPISDLTADVTASRREWVYEVDPPHARVAVPLGRAAGAARGVFSGVTALVALAEGRLLVLERSAAAGIPPFEARVYLVDTAAAGTAEGRADIAAPPVPKRLLWRGQPGLNLEGLCLGPALADGRVAVLGVADNSSSGAGATDRAAPNPVVVFSLTNP